ncbi:MAG TPA: hypothetical protein VF763_12265 [Candidatus Limnocylindrales bacterium]
MTSRSALVRIVVLVPTGALVLLAAWNLSLLVPHVLEQKYALGVDLHQYLAATRRWLDGQGFYYPHQIAGPYHIVGGDILYPPVVLWLLVPFLVVPEVVWWLIPLGIVAYAVWRLRPAPWTWPLLAFAVWYPRDEAMVLFGNPGLYVGAAIAGGVLWAWPAVFAVFKPSLAPFALIGVRHRSWWVALAGFVLLCLPFGGLWLDFVAAIRNSDGTIWYSVPDLPFMLIPVVAWLGRTRPAPVETAVPLGLAPILSPSLRTARP